MLKYKKYFYNSLYFLLVLPNIENKTVINEEPIVEVINQKIDTIEVNCSYYLPSLNQCDSTPLITADNSFIDTNKLKNNKIKWCAISRNLLKQNGGAFNYGDTIMLITNDKYNKKKYIIHDCMNKRFKNKIDILTIKKIKINKSIKIVKL